MRSANELALRAGDPDAEWPRLVVDVVQRLAEIGDLPEASVARRRLSALLADVRDRRDRHAAAEFETAAAAAAELPLDRAGRQFEALAETLRLKFFGEERSELIDAAKATARSFRDASSNLDAHFAEFERSWAADGGSARGNFRALEAALDRAQAAALADVPLRSLLAALPPAGTRGGTIEARRDLLHARLTVASADAWEKIRRDAEDQRARREYDAAAATLSEFAVRALDLERDKALAVQTELERINEGADSDIRNATDETSARYFEALGRRDYARARTVLDELAAVARSARSLPNPADEFVEVGRRLLDLIERHVWNPLRTRLGKGGVLERGLSVRSGQGYIRHQGVHDVILQPQGRELTFASDSGPATKSSLDDVALDDVIHYAGLTPADPERALALVAMRLAEHQPPQDTAEGLKQLGAAAPILDAARGATDFAPIVARLARVRDELVAAARGQIQEAEVRAEAIHRSALAALSQGRYDDAWRGFQSLLDLKSFYRSAYVKGMRDEIVKERDAASEGRQSANYGARFPGGAFSKSSDGSGELSFDFESPLMDSAETRKLLGLVEGRTQISSRPGVITDRPGLLRPGAPGGVPLVLDHALVWRPADAVAGPRNFPVSIDCPFSMRARITVSFLYRSDEPLFLAISIGGVTAGVLSAPEERYGGRGIEIWNATDLDNPDKAFDSDDRHRSSYLAKHPELLRKEGDRRFFHFEPGRTYRVEFVKDERKAWLSIDGQMRVESDWRATTGALEGKIVLLSFDAGEVDDLRITGILDPEWLHGR